VLAELGAAGGDLPSCLLGEGGMDAVVLSAAESVHCVRQVTGAEQARRPLVERPGEWRAALERKGLLLGTMALAERRGLQSNPERYRLRDALRDRFDIRTRTASRYLPRAVRAGRLRSCDDTAMSELQSLHAEVVDTVARLDAVPVRCVSGICSMPRQPVTAPRHR
jgi:hypothetical protein